MAKLLLALLPVILCAAWCSVARAAPHKVPVVQWTADATLQSAVDSHGTEPFVLRDSVVSKWAALKWDPSVFVTTPGLLSVVPAVRVLKASERVIRYKDMTAPLAPFTYGISAQGTTINTTGPDMWLRYGLGADSQAPRAQVWYFSSPVTSELLLDCAPHFDWLTVHRSLCPSCQPVPSQDTAATGATAAVAGDATGTEPAVAQRAAAEPTSQAFLWTNDAETATAMHFDMSENFFLQIRGRKRFTLYSPRLWSDARTFPLLHPHNRQSQSPPTFAPDEAWTVELEPGDLLFLPAFWFHYVESLTDAMSVNVWTESAMELRLTRALEQVALPLEDEWADEQRLSGVLQLLATVHAALDGGTASSAAAALSADVLTPLFGRYRTALGMRSDAQRWCGSRTAALEPATVAHIDAGCARWVAVFEAIPAVERRILFSDFVERLLLWAVGPEHVYGVLEDCRA